MSRAMLLFQKQGLEPIPAPIDYANYWEHVRWEKAYIPNAWNLLYVTAAWHEALGKVWAKLVGQI